MPKGISSAMNKISTENTSRINEIRLRINKPVSVSSYGKNYFVTENGGLTTHKKSGNCCAENDIK